MALIRVTVSSLKTRHWYLEAHRIEHHVPVFRLSCDMQYGLPVIPTKGGGDIAISDKSEHLEHAPCVSIEATPAQSDAGPARSAVGKQSEG